MMGTEQQPAVGGSIAPDADGRHVLFADGASRGNPGLAGAGAALYAPDGSLLRQVWRFVGPASTNNEAEYWGALEGLQLARRLGVDSVSLRMDSDLVVRQINGSYAVKAANLKPLHGHVAKLARVFADFRVSHVPRAENGVADALANRAIDEYTVAPDEQTR